MGVMKHLILLCTFYTFYCQYADTAVDLPAPELIPPEIGFRVTEEWTFTFRCAMRNLTGPAPDTEPQGVTLNVTGGPASSTNQTFQPIGNDTGLYDVILEVETTLSKGEGYTYKCVADYNGTMVEGEEADIEYVDTGVDLNPHPALYRLYDNVTFACAIDKQRLSDGDAGALVGWVYQNRTLAIYEVSTGTETIEPDFKDKVLLFDNAQDFGLSEVTLTVDACDIQTTLTCVILTTQNLTALDSYNISFIGDEGFPLPFGSIIGPEPPTDGSDWTFTYDCGVDEAVEQPEVKLEVNSTGGGVYVSNTTASQYNLETCLGNYSLSAEFNLPLGGCVTLTCVARYPGQEKLNFTDAPVCYESHSGNSGISAEVVVAIVFGCVMLVVLLVVGIRCYRRRQKGYDNIEKIQ